MRLHGKSVLVTGAARGLGRAPRSPVPPRAPISPCWTSAPTCPACPTRWAPLGSWTHTAALCREAGAAVLTAEADIRDLRAVREAVTRAEDRFGRIDVAVNNAGIAAPSGKPVHEIAEEEWSLMIDVDLSGAWRVIREVGKAMSARRAGSIVNVASTAGLVGYRHFAGYVAAKHAVVGSHQSRRARLRADEGARERGLPGSVRDDAWAEGRMLAEIARALEVPGARAREDLRRGAAHERPDRARGRRRRGGLPRLGRVPADHRLGPDRGRRVQHPLSPRPGRPSRPTPQ